MTSQAVTSAVNFIRTFKSAQIGLGEPVELDKHLIARIEAVFQHFRMDSIEGWNQVNDHMRIYYGYGQSVWTFNDTDHVTSMFYCKGSPIPSKSSSSSSSSSSILKETTLAGSEEVDKLPPRRRDYKVEIPEGADPWGHI